MNRRLLHALALALPLAGLGAIWAQTHRQSLGGTEWDVPVAGYDPRDLLRGHYVQFQYDWPGLKNEQYGGNLCLEGVPPRLVRVRPVDDAAVAAGARPCDQLALGLAHVADMAGGTMGGRLYASKEAATAMQDRLANPKLQGMLRMRLRADGHITPLRLTFRPRPSAPAATRPPR